MQSIKLTKCALACIAGFVVTSNVYAQTQRQQNNPLDQLQPTDNSVSYDVPAITTTEELVEGKQTFSVNSIVLKSVVPNSAGTAPESFEQLNDPQLNQHITQKLNANNNRLTYSQLQLLAAELSQVLRERGELLSTVYVPAQTVQQGQLELHLLQGTLGKVTVQGQETGSEDVISGVFQPYVGEVVSRGNIESQLLRIQNLLPGVSALGAFRQGDKLGQSDAVINVTEFESFSGSVYLDNYGNDTTGEHRLGTRMVFNNPTGMEDRLRVDILANETPDGFDDPNNPIKKDDLQCCFGGLSYEMFTDSLKYSFGIEWSHTQYDIGNNADAQLAMLGFSGESNTTRLFAKYYSNLTSAFSDTWTLGWSYSRSDLSARNHTLGQDVLLNRDRVPELDLGYTFTLRDGQDVYFGHVAGFFEPSKYGGFPLPEGWVGHSETTTNSLGMLVPASRAGADDGSSTRLNADLNAVIGSLSDSIRLEGRLALQLSNDILAPFQQFSIAGPYGVRAYPSGSFLADEGLLASVDVVMPVTSSLDLSVFYDIGHGESNELDPASVFDATIQGIGAGLNFRYDDALVVQVTAAYGLGVSDGENGQPGPNIRNGGEEVTGRDDTQFFASIIYNF